MTRIVPRHEAGNLVPPELTPEETLTLKRFDVVPMNLSGLAIEHIETLKQWEREAAQFSVKTLVEGLIKLSVQSVTDEPETAHTYKLNYTLIRSSN